MNKFTKVCELESKLRLIKWGTGTKVPFFMWWPHMIRALIMVIEYVIEKLDEDLNEIFQKGKQPNLDYDKEIERERINS